jgi:DNA-binding MarR family transcriptional regulator
VSNDDAIPFTVTHEVRDACLCLQVQRAARALARRYDVALRPLGLTSGQFSLLMSLNRPQPPTMGQVASVLAMDRTTLTANLKPLQRRRLVTVAADEEDKRTRRLRLTAAGRKRLVAALPVWRDTQARIAARLGASDPARLLADLLALSAEPEEGR